MELYIQSGVGRFETMRLNYGIDTYVTWTDPSGCLRF